MAVKLVFIGRLEDAAGAGEMEIEAGSTLDAVLEGLDPDLAQELRDERIRVAVNGKVLADKRKLETADGDEIAFLPPVSGGSA